MTQAESISKMFHDDGLCFVTDAGLHLNQVCMAHEPETVEHEEYGTAYRFRDGSSIIATNGGWDLGIQGATCWCCDCGAGKHVDGCEYHHS